MSARDLLLFSFRNYLLGAQIPLGGQVGVEAQARPAPRLKLVLEIIPHYLDSLSSDLNCVAVLYTRKDLGENVFENGFEEVF